MDALCAYCFAEFADAGFDAGCSAACTRYVCAHPLFCDPTCADLAAEQREQSLLQRGA